MKGGDKDASFVKAARAFVPLKLDTRNGRFHTEEFKVSRNNAYIIFRDHEGEEIARLKNPRSMKVILEKMKEIADATAHDRPEVLRYLYSYRVIDKGVRDGMEKLVDDLANDDWETRDKATSGLVRMGYPAYVLLSGREKESDLEVRLRIEKVLLRLKPIHEIMERRGLDHDVEFLSRLKSDKARARLKTILPPGVRAGDWSRQSKDYFWNPVKQKFVSKPR